MSWLWRLGYRGAFLILRLWWFLRRPRAEGAAVMVWRGDALLLVRTSYRRPLDLPGGGMDKGETPLAAALRELREETGLVIAPSALVRVGVYEGGGRDPRDGDASWSRSSAFLVHVADGPAMVAGGDDAADARWFPLEALPRELAFDHARIVADALALPAVIAPS